MNIETFDSIIDSWKKVLPVSDFSNEDSFYDLGGTSLLAMLMLNEIEKTFSASVFPEEFNLDPTVMGIFKILQSKFS